MIRFLCFGLIFCTANLVAQTKVQHKKALQLDTIHVPKTKKDGTVAKGFQQNIAPLKADSPLKKLAPKQKSKR